MFRKIWQWIQAWTFKQEQMVTIEEEDEPREAIVERESDLPGATTESIIQPLGKGIFVRTVSRATLAGTPGQLAAQAVDLDLEWVALIAIWQHPDRSKVYENLVEPAACLHESDRDVWIWGWPDPNRDPAEFATEMAFAASETNARGLIINAEKPYYRKPRQAEQLCQMLVRAVGTEMPIGLSSYAATWFHGRFPFRVFSHFCDFGMPQIYDTKHRMPADYPQRAFDGWREHGFKRIVPTWGASMAHTPQCMRDIINRTPAARAVCWWDMHNVRHSRRRQDVISEYQLPVGLGDVS